ncbi:unnamed protein product, partial [Allacma fusca]
MPGSDIIMGWFTDNGDFILNDYYAEKSTAPIKDPSQDVELIEAEQMDNGFRFVFRRRWDTCDDNDFKIQDDTVRIIWAWSDEIPVDGALPWHAGNRGVQSAFLKHRIGGAFRIPEQ